MSDLPNIIVCGRTEAAKYLHSLSLRPPVEALISIGSPDEKPPSGWKLVPNRIRLDFADIDMSDEGGVREAGYHLRAPNPMDVLRVIRFARRNRDLSGTLLVHCYAGISRSAACAIAVAATWLGPERLDEAVAAVFAARPHSYPHREIVNMADAMLGLNGDLIRTVEAQQPRLLADEVA